MKSVKNCRVRISAVSSNQFETWFAQRFDTGYECVRVGNPRPIGTSSSRNNLAGSQTLDVSDFNGGENSIFDDCFSWDRGSECLYLNRNGWRKPYLLWFILISSHKEDCTDSLSCSLARDGLQPCTLGNSACSVNKPRAIRRNCVPNKVVCHG